VIILRISTSSQLISLFAPHQQQQRRQRQWSPSGANCKRYIVDIVLDRAVL
jgi:hypothetical protein